MQQGLPGKTGEVGDRRVSTGSAIKWYIKLFHYRRNQGNPDAPFSPAADVIFGPILQEYQRPAADKEAFVATGAAPVLLTPAICSAAI